MPEGEEGSPAAAFALKAKQCFPVERKISTEGRFRHFTPKSVHALGKAGSHVILQCSHLKQSGARSGIFTSGEESYAINQALPLSRVLAIELFDNRVSFGYDRFRTNSIKTAKYIVFCGTWETTNRVVEQVQYRGEAFRLLFCKTRYGGAEIDSFTGYGVFYKGMKKISGIPASPGIVSAKAFLYLETDTLEIPRYNVLKNQIEAEIERFKKAVEEAASEIRGLYERAKREMGNKQADIFAAHLMMIEDVDFHAQISDSLKDTLFNIEWVVHDAVKKMAHNMLSQNDPVFRERASDINDVGRRVLSRLLSVKRVSLADLDRDVIIVAHDLLPSEALTINRNHVKGIVLNTGSGTSHAAIIARAFGIPAVLGLTSATSEINNDDLLVIDAARGEVFINPEKSDIEKFERAGLKYQKKLDGFSQLKDLPAETLDGRLVLMKANIGISDEAETALTFGAEGIGLYRSEFLFMSASVDSGEESQLHIYGKVLEKMGGLPVTIRTVDLGGDKVLPDLYQGEEKNPILGWRAIRFSLSLPELFKTQLRAILRSGVHGNVKIMFPMISGLEELDQALALLEEAKAECRKRKQNFADDIETGIMIEVPSAAVTADILAKRSGFFSIGTNDLVQYSLAVDRGNEKVSYLAQPLHPAVLKLIKTAIDAAHRRGIKAAMCGEMAGDPAMTPLLLGLGLDEFSMTSSSIPQIKSVVRKVKQSACEEIARELLDGVSFMANKALLKAWMTENFPGI